MAIASADSSGRCDAREISHAEVAIRPMPAADRPGAQQARERQPPSRRARQPERSAERRLRALGSFSPLDRIADRRAHAATATRPSSKTRSASVTSAGR